MTTVNQSIVQQRGSVPFPAFTGERVYMREFRKADGLPIDLRRWQPTVDAMLQGIDTDTPIYIMIDQGRVMAGSSHRRPGVHLDGYWVPAIRAHSGRGGHVTGEWDTGRRWKQCDFSQPEALILASDVVACRAYEGVWEGECGEGGDCSHIDTSHMRKVLMQSGVAYAGNVTMLHESLPLMAETTRTLVRLSVPNWTPTH